jgi:hypothetical protein
MTTPQPLTDPLAVLAKELRAVRAADTAVDLEPRVDELRALLALAVVRARVRGGTALGKANAVISVVTEAARRFRPERPEHIAAQILFRVHPRTQGLTPARARRLAEEARGVGPRQFRAREELRLCRLVAQAILELEAEHTASEQAGE